MSRIQRSRSVGQMVVALGAWALATSVPAVATAQTVHQISELATRRYQVVLEQVRVVFLGHGHAQSSRH
jgi:hypothetical protein